MNIVIRMSTSMVNKSTCMHIHMFMTTRMNTNKAAKKHMSMNIPGSMAPTSIPTNDSNDPPEVRSHIATSGYFFSDITPLFLVFVKQLRRHRTLPA